MSIPEMLLNKMLNSNISNNPMANNILNMARRGDVKSIEQFGRNIANERGVNFDAEFEKFKHQFGK